MFEFNRDGGSPLSGLDLLVVHPGAAHATYGADLSRDLVAVESPLWSRLIAGWARDRGYSVRIVDAEAEGKSPAMVAADVFAYRPRLVCIAAYGHQPSASTQQMEAAGETARQIRSVSGAKIIMVGGHVAALPERTLVEEQIDYACRGEGPLTVEGLLRGDGLADIPDLVWRSDGKTIHLNDRAPLVEDLGTLRGDTWDLLPMERYRAHNWQCLDDPQKRQPYASVYTSLGCSYKCSFCCISAPFGGNRYRMRPPADVVDEIALLHEQYGVSTFKIIDEMFVLNERHYTAVCEGLAALPFADELNIWAYARVDTVREGRLALLRRAGIRWIALGVESGSSYVRDGAQKRLKNNDIMGVVRRIQAAGINVIANYIFGLPDDDLNSMRATLVLAQDMNTEFANFYSAMAYPGSPLYEESVREGRTLPESWKGFSQHNSDCRPLDTKHVSAATVLQFRDEAFRAYFTSPRYQDMILEKFGWAAVEETRKMTRYRLPRKLLERAERLEQSELPLEQVQ